MVSWIVRIIVILIILRFLYRMIMGPVRRPKHERNGTKKAVPLVRDPVCGTFLLPDRAVKTGAGDDTLYFCSENCRAQYDPAAKP